MGRVEAWAPGVPGIREVFHAHMVDYAYPAHCHDTWAVLIVDDGAIRYDLDGRLCGAAGQTVTLLPPGVPHVDVEARLALIAERITGHLTTLPGRLGHEPGLAWRFRSLLDEHLCGELRLAWVAAALDRSVPHLVRGFTRESGISPYAYVVGRRISPGCSSGTPPPPPARYARSHAGHRAMPVTQCRSSAIAFPAGPAALSGAG